MAKKRMGKEELNNQLLEEAQAYLRVLYWFFAYPDRVMGLNDLKDEVGIAKTTANRVVKRLEEEKFLNVEVIGKVWRISTVKNHPYNITTKMPSNLTFIYATGLIDEILREYPDARAIILFGSYRKGEDTEESDLDIAVEVAENTELKIEDFGLITHLGYRANVRASLHVFNRKRIDLNLFTSIANGIILWGLLEVKP